MGYCTIQDIRDMLPRNITIGDNVVPTVTSVRANTISTSVANKYIYFATQFIDSRLAQIYIVPLIKIKKISVDLLANMLPASTDVKVSDITGFHVGSTILIKDDNNSEYATVSDIAENMTENGTSVMNFNHLTISSPSVNAYDPGSHGTVHLLTYSDPVPVMSARLACSLMFDKLFVADQSPDVSSYGKTLRNLSKQDMNGILTGQIRLTGQEFYGRRFARHQLYDAVQAAIENLNVDQGMEGA